MNKIDRKSTRHEPKTGGDGGDVIPLKQGKLVLAHVVFLTRFKYPIPFDVNGRVQLLMRLFNLVPRNWQRYVELLKMKTGALLTIYRGIFVGNEEGVVIRPSDFDRTAIVGAMKTALLKAGSILPRPPFVVFVFPRFFSTLSVDGHCFIHEALHLFINPKGDWQSLLPSTLCHEYFHLVYKLAHRTSANAGQAMLQEALGMHFAEEITGYRYPRDVRLTDEIASVWLRKKRKILENGSSDKFYATRMQPRGYQCGYLMVRSLLKTMKTRGRWRTIATAPPEVIYKLAWKKFVDEVGA